MKKVNSQGAPHKRKNRIPAQTMTPALEACLGKYPPGFNQLLLHKPLFQYDYAA
jgi:hypothetical protein